MTKKIFSVLALSFVITVAASAQSRLDVPGVALGRSTVASSRGIDALTTNPAGISIDSRRSFSFILPNLNLLFGNDFLDVKRFKYFFGGDGTFYTASDNSTKPNPRRLTDAERDELADVIDGGQVMVNSELMPIALLLNLEKIGTFGFTITSTTQGYNRFADGLGGMMKGYLGEQPLIVENAGVSALSYSTYQLSYARNFILPDTMASQRSWLDGLSAGISLKYLRGYGYLKLQDDNYTRITPFVPAGWENTKNWDVAMNYRYQSSMLDSLQLESFSPAGYVLGYGESVGSGFGADLGVVMNIHTDNSTLPSISFGISAMDIGAITWNDNTQEYSLNVKDTVDNYKDILENDSTLTSKYQATRKNIASFSSTLPTRVRVGGAVYLDRLIRNFSVPLMVTLEYSQGVNNEGINSTTPRVSMGLQYTSIGAIPTVRTGIQFGGREGFLWSGGLGWNIKNVAQIDLSLGSLSPLRGLGSTKWVDVAFRVRADIGI